MVGRSWLLPLSRQGFCDTRRNALKVSTARGEINDDPTLGPTANYHREAKAYVDGEDLSESGEMLVTYQGVEIMPSAIRRSQSRSISPRTAGCKLNEAVVRSQRSDDRGSLGKVVASRRPVNHAIKEVGLTEFSARPLRGESRPHRYRFGFVAWQQRTASATRDGSITLRRFARRTVLPGLCGKCTHTRS